MMIMTTCFLIMIICAAQISARDSFSKNRSGDHVHKFFMYPLDRKWWWAWPDEECHPGSLTSPAHKELSGMGKLVDKGIFI